MSNRSKENICDDRPIEVPEHIKQMTDKEIDTEFEKRFRQHLNEKIRCKECAKKDR